MGQKFRVQLVGDETHDIEAVHRDLMLTETTLVKAGLDATGQKTPVHYVTALIWAALVRLGLTSAKWHEFPDLLVDFDRLDKDGNLIQHGQPVAEDAGPDPTQPAALTGPPSASPPPSVEAPTTG